VPALQLTAAADLLGDTSGILSGLDSTLATDLGGLESTMAADLGSSLTSVSELLSSSGLLPILDEIENTIQQTLNLFGFELVRNAINDVTLVVGVITNEVLFSPLGTGLDDLGAPISNISPVLGPIGTIFDDLGNLSTVIGNTIQDFGVNLVPAIDTPLFDIPVQLVNFGSALFDLLTGQPVAADASALPDLGTLPDLSALLDVGTLPDLSGLSDIGLSSLSGIVTDLGSTLLTLFP